MVKLTTCKKYVFHPPTTCNRNPSITEAWKICTFSSHEKQVKIWLVLASINLPSSPRLLNPFLFLSSQPCCIVYIHCHLTAGNDEWVSSSCAQFWMLPFFSHCCDLTGRKCLFLCRLTILGDYFLVVGRYNSRRGSHGSGNRGPAGNLVSELRNRKSGWVTNPQALTPVIYLLQRTSFSFDSLPKQHQQLELKCLNTWADGGQVTF